MGLKNTERLAIGIDGGGTKSVGCLINTKGELLARIVGRPTNYRKDHEPMILERIVDLQQRLMRAANMPHRRPEVLAACLSGLGQEWARGRVRNLLSSAFLSETIVAESDARAALHGAFAGGEGIILIAGTGSIAFGKGAQGGILRCGGWGFLLGDEGSGFDIGRNAIVAALKDFDGRGERTSLRSRLEQHFGVSQIDDAVQIVYTRYTERGALAEFTPMVFEEAAKGDRVAQEILRNAAREYGILVATLATRLDLKPEVQVALMGNIFRQHEILLPEMERVWHESGRVVKRVSPKFSADIGAALLGLSVCGIPFEPEAEERLVHAQNATNPA